MLKLATGIAGAVLVLSQVACSDTQPTTAPRLAAAGAAQADEHGRDGHTGVDRLLTMLDACDGPSFSAQHIACARSGGVSFQQFIDEVTRKGSVGGWEFAPPKLALKLGESFAALNRGGEAHTFTEVAHFGGGIVPSLNQLSGNPVPAAECLALAPSAFVAPGMMSMPDVADETGTELYQCCIHPWMRTVVTVKRS